MILDAQTGSRDALAEPFDVCIIGSGPAGITLARKLAATGVRIALMEGGEDNFEPRSQQIYEGEVTGIPYWPLDFPRLRLFGGSSQHWAGWCRALDEIDFEDRPGAMGGWPILRADLAPFTDETEAILELEPLPDEPPLTQAARRFHGFTMRYSPPVRFADTYRDELEQTPNLVLAFNANLVDMRLTEAEDRIETAHFRTYDPADQGFTITARQFCLCTGGIENARLLLNFRSQQPAGIGNRNGLVGRHFCEHPHFTIGDILLSRDVADLEFYRPTRELMDAEGILNFGLRLEPSRLNPPGAPAREAIADCDATLTRSLALAVGASALAAPGGFLDRSTAAGCPTATLRIAQAQSLVPESRVRLSDRTDSLGLLRTDLHWILSELDIHTMRRAAFAFGEHLAEQDLGRLRIRSWLLDTYPRLPGPEQDEVGGKHHMCTTRMSDDPRLGVVDRDCRVHGLDNLYIGGSSVFATPGQSNPTYTIIQLTLRLAGHLSARLAEPSR